MTRTIVVEELARVEGHGGIEVEMEGDTVSAVRFNVFEGPRLLESLLNGRSYVEVAPLISRICAICSAAHYITSLKATEAAFETPVTPQTETLRELLFRGENIESHALHVFLLAAPDYLGFAGATDMAAQYPEVVRLGLDLKQLGNRIQEIIAGRAIHPIYPVLGGFAQLPTTVQLAELRDRIDSALDRVPLMVAFMRCMCSEQGCRTDTTYAALTSNELGYSGSADVVFVDEAGKHHFSPRDYSLFTNERIIAHSNAKHSVFRDRPFMVGALARLHCNATTRAAADELLGQFGLTLPATDPLDNNKAQAIELVLDLQWCRAALDRLIRNGVQEEGPVPVLPRAGTGTAITEAPRGLLVHSYTYDEEFRVASADVITPTAMNAASIERHFREGVEQSADKSNEALQRRLELIARAYDPCISCSVHMVRLKRDAG